MKAENFSVTRQIASKRVNIISAHGTIRALFLSKRASTGVSVEVDGLEKDGVRLYPHPHSGSSLPLPYVLAGLKMSTTCVGGERSEEQTK